MKGTSLVACSLTTCSSGKSLAPLALGCRKFHFQPISFESLSILCHWVRTIWVATFYCGRQTGLRWLCTWLHFDGWGLETELDCCGCAPASDEPILPGGPEPCVPKCLLEYWAFVLLCRIVSHVHTGLVNVFFPKFFCFFRACTFFCFFSLHDSVLFLARTICYFFGPAQIFPLLQDTNLCRDSLAPSAGLSFFLAYISFNAALPPSAPQLATLLQDVTAEQWTRNTCSSTLIEDMSHLKQIGRKTIVMGAGMMVLFLFLSSPASFELAQDLYILR